MAVPLIGPTERAELEALILSRLGECYSRDGAASLLEPEIRVNVTGRGVEVAQGLTVGALASVEVRQLFTAVCYLAGASGPVDLPAEALVALAKEATSAAAAQINKISQ